MGGMALALGLYLTDTLHLFFLFLPVYVLTVVLYIVLAAVSGARAPITRSEDDTAVDEDHLYTDESAQEANESGLASRRHHALAFWTSGLIALASLIVCAGFAVLMFSNFIPIATAGLLVALTMITTSLAAMTVLPVLLNRLRPRFLTKRI
jgi:hypothetical protein